MASSRWWYVAAAAALSLVIVPPLASADVTSGDRITSENVAKGKDLISPGLEWCIEHGFPIAVTETKRVAWPRAYAEATEKYAAQVKLSPEASVSSTTSPACPSRTSTRRTRRPR